MKFSYEQPDDYENEERWLKFFTLRSLLCSLGAFVIGIFLGKFLSLFHLPSITGTFIGLILAAIVYFITMKKMPEDDYLKGGGQPIEKYLVNRIYRKFHSYIYVLGFGNIKEV